MIADNLSFQFLLPNASSTIPPLLHDIDRQLQKKNDFEYIVLEDVCPIDPRKQYEFLKALKLYELALVISAPVSFCHFDLSDT